MKISKNIANERAGLRVEQNQLAIEHIKSQKKKITKNPKIYIQHLRSQDISIIQRKMHRKVGRICMRAICQWNLSIC